MLRLFLFGTPRIEQGRAPVPLRRTKALALLAYLAMTRKPHDREALIALLWPEFDQASARNNLRRELSLLRAILGEEVISADRLQIAWNPGVDLWLDVAVFQEQLARDRHHTHLPGDLCAECAEQLAAAVQLYTDDFMAGFSLPDCPAFDDWLFFEREALRQQLAGALEQLAGWHRDQQAFDIAVRYARRWLALDQLHEPAHRTLMHLYALCGQQAAAIRQYQECVRVLDAELGITPEPETTELYEAIRTRRLVPASEPAAQAPAAQGAFNPTAAQAPAVQPAPTRVHNLPAEVSPLIGREREVHEVAAQLTDPHCRLLTLVGPGGIGKTRLALAVLRTVASSFTHGACFAGMASIDTPDLIAQAMLGALSIALNGAVEPEAQLLDYLRDKQLLLLVDNFEHLGEGRALLSRIVATAPQVTLLVTTREELQLPEEWVYPVHGMEYPPAIDSTASMGDLEAYGAVRLFLSTARRVRAGYTPRPDDLPHIVRICRQLDGMPLGIELAAAWTRSLRCSEIADEIAHNLDFLSVGEAQPSARHRSLRAVYEQTWQRLPVVEQQVLQRLAIFRGGCLRDAAEQVAGASLATLQALMARALVRRDARGRYDMHELIRQFALERLQRVSEEYQHVRDRHCAYYIAFLRQRRDDVRGGRRPEAAREIDADLDNIRAAWQLAIEQRDVANIMQASECLWEYCELRSTYTEGVHMFGQAAQALAEVSTAQEAPTPDPGATVARGFTMAAQGHLRARSGHAEEGCELIRRGIALMREAPQRTAHLEAIAVLELGFASYEHGDYPRTRACGQEALPTFVANDDLWGIAACFLLMGSAALEEGALEEATYFFEEGLRACRRGGIRAERHFANYQLVRIAFMQGEYIKATQYIAENAAINQEDQNPRTLSNMLRQRGTLALAQGKLTQALDDLQRFIAIWREHGIQPRAALCLIAQVYRLQGNYAAAHEVLLEALANSQTFGQRGHVAQCLYEMGKLALDRGDLVQAEPLLREALTIASAPTNSTQAAEVMCVLGHVLAAMGPARAGEAQQCLREALHFATQRRLVPLMLEACAGVARLQIGQGGLTSARQLLVFVQGHPASTYETRQRARKYIAMLPATPENTADLAIVGHGRDWVAVAEDLLAQL